MSTKQAFACSAISDRPYRMSERPGSDDGAVSLDVVVTPWTLSEPRRRLDPQQLGSVQISGEVKSEKLKVVIKKVGWAGF
ncbi:MAG: hypothetical protein NTW87_04330 [Planctomycetota bacterium]|nr:hypothetical protein [Planctomycetota bacterium]